MSWRKSIPAARLLELDEEAASAAPAATTLTTMVDVPGQVVVRERPKERESLEQGRHWLIDGLRHPSRIVTATAPLLHWRPGHRFQPQDRRRLPLAVVGDQVDVALWPLPDVPDAAHLRHERLFADDTPPIERQPDQPLARHTADEQAAAPFRKAFAGIEHRSGDADRRDPQLCRLLHALRCVPVWMARPV